MHHARHSVVQQVALVDGLHEQLVLRAPARRPRAAGGDRCRPAHPALLLAGVAGCDERGHQAPLREEQLAQGARPLIGRDPTAVAAAARALGQAGEGGGGGLAGALDVLVGVGQRWEPGLELGGRRVHAAGEQLPAPGGVGLQVTGLGVGERPHGALAEEHRHQAGRADDLHGIPARLRRPPRPGRGPGAR